MEEAATKKLKQPKILYLSFITAMAERFGYYVISFLIVLIMKDIYKLSDDVAFQIAGIFIALAYLTPAIGGYLADKVIGIKRCLGLGLLIEMVGYILLALPTNDEYIVAIAFGAIIVGAGIFKTAPTNLLGKAYEEDDPRIDSGFTLFYMGINVGSFSSSLIAGPVKDAFGWGVPFMIAAAVLFLGFIWFMFFKHHGKGYESEKGLQHFSLFKWTLAILGCMIMILISGAMIIYITVGTAIFYVLSTLIFLYLIWEIISSKKEDRIKIIVCIILIIIAAGFFVLYFQLYQSVVLFIQRNVNKDLFGLKISTPIFLGMNGFAIIILSPFLAAVYNFLEKRKKDLAITSKFTLGLIVIGFSYLLLYFASIIGNVNGQISCLWVILFIALYS